MESVKGAGRDNIAEYVHASVAPLVDQFRSRQNTNGSLISPTEADADLLKAITARVSGVYRDLDEAAQAEALAADVRDWLASGLDSVPDFGRSRDALRPPVEGGVTMFLGPTQTTNSVPPVGKRLECFFALRREPRSFQELNDRFPHPKNNCQSMVLLAASEGIRRGNCLVFFPENVAATSPVGQQAYAMFFFSKFRKIHETYAGPAARAVLGSNFGYASLGLSPDDCYEARSMWGYLHDRSHYQGLWPFDQHIALKMNWFVGLLEETKVDAMTILQCAAGGVPFAREQIDMILLERMFRYPIAADATRNFDSGTGVLLYSWLNRSGAMFPDGDFRGLDRDAALESIQDYVDAIDRLERTVHTDAEYKAEAKAFVRQFLLPDPADKDRFAFTAEQSVLLRARDFLGTLPPLEFQPGEL